MKKWRVLASAAVLTALVLFACLVPVPVSRIRGSALILADPSATGKVYVLHDPGAILTKLNIRPGNYVREGEVIAEFSDPELDAELLKAEIERDNAYDHKKTLENKLRQTTDPRDREKLITEIGNLNSKYLKAETQVRNLERVRDEDLVLTAPCSGVIGVAPAIDDITKFFPADPTNPFCTINNPGRVRVCVPIVTPDFDRLKQALEQVSPAAVGTRKLMKRRVTVAYDNTRLADVLADLKKQVKELKWTLPKDAGHLDDLTVSYKAENQRLGTVLGALLERMGLGFVIVSEADSADDGHLLIRPGSECGEPDGGRPLADLDVTIRVQGRDSQTWKGKIRQLPESEAKTVSRAMSNRAGGPVAVKAGAGAQSGTLVPATQQYLVYVEILDADESILPGTMAQVKIYCQPETCVHWLWRTLNQTFDLGLM